MQHHAIEITIRRPLPANDIHRLQKRLPLAPNADRTRLMTLVPAKTEQRALERLRRQVGHLVPIDMLAAHYPDKNGTLLLNFAFSEEDTAYIRRAASDANQTPDIYLRQQVTAALERETEVRNNRLQAELEPLLTNHTPQELLLAAARVITRYRPPPSHTVPTKSTEQEN